MKNNNRILSIKNSSFLFQTSGFRINNLDIEIGKGDFIGLVGESGAGKSTIGKLLACLYTNHEPNGLELNDGKLQYYDNDGFRDKNLFDCSYSQLIPFRKEVQYLFQNHRAAVHRNMTVKQTMMEAAQIKYPQKSKKGQMDVIEGILGEVGLLDHTSKNGKSDSIYNKKSRNLSGGQIKRLALGRTLLMEPKIIIADEPLTGLDASRKGRILEYLTTLWEKRSKTENPLTIILISHDIGMVLRLCNRVLVIYGDLYSKSSYIIEDNLSTGYKVNTTNIHPYSKNLLAATNYFKTGESSGIVEGSKIQKSDSKVGCNYYSYCPMRTEDCENKKQILKIFKKDHSHKIACSVLNP